MDKKYKSSFIKTKEELEYDFRILNSNSIIEENSISNLNYLENKINDSIKKNSSLIKVTLKNSIEFK
ncbi:MAG TPA: hypothetical protein PK294_05655 [Ignavibacteria bacterium]|nr:hypothetical protein [Ignavibacteria bacterium]HQY53134.1 hypothetical protein [Ignavibacteria bacterium]HRA99906.1 hypothetical protein [Ignavibacteria bacterium]